MAVCLCVFLQLLLLSLFNWKAHEHVFVFVFASLPADPLGVSNGNHESFPSNSDAKLNNMVKTLQETLTLKGSSLSSSGFCKQPRQTSSPDLLNGKNRSTNSIQENSSQNNKTPTTPARTPRPSQVPVPYPRTSLSVGLSGTGGAQRTQESPKSLRNVRGEATLSPKPHVRSTENSSLSHKTSSVKFPPAAPSSPRLRGSSLQRRSPSPMREQGHVSVPQRMTGSTSSREIPPLSLDVSSRATSGSPGVLESPQGHRKPAPPSKAEAMKALFPHSLEKESGSRLLQLGPTSAIMSGSGSGSGLSPLPSPRSQRKTSSMSVKGPQSKEGSLMKPHTRERKNSISEISDNEDELLEYHRWQREERLREQEMEKLVRN